MATQKQGKPFKISSLCDMTFLYNYFIFYQSLSNIYSKNAAIFDKNISYSTFLSFLYPHTYHKTALNL